MGQKETIYSGKTGDKLIDPSVYPKEIQQFLFEETQILASLGSEYNMLVEVGCMFGRFLNWSLEQGKTYLGIDIEERYINQGKNVLVDRKIETTKADFICGSAENLPGLFSNARIKLDRLRPLLFFPFNSFGNMDDPIAVIKGLSVLKWPFLISSYQTNLEAIKIRKRYYSNCGYHGVEVVSNSRGIIFRSQEGLRTYAYHPEFLRRASQLLGLVLSTIYFSGDLGLAYFYKGESYIEGRSKISNF